MALAEPSPTGPRILIVDDERLIREILADFLSVEGYCVRTAADGAVAINELRRARYDVVITDLKMPNVGGLDLLAEVRRTSPQALTLVMTGFGTVETAIDAMKRGAYDYVLKPFRVEQVLGLIRDGLAARSQIDELPVSSNSSPRSEREAEEALRQRLERAYESMWMAYHPILWANGGSVFGYEALLRGQEPSLADPPSVIWAAERLGQVERLQRRARALVAQAFEGAPAETLLFVNLLPSDLMDSSLFDRTAPLTKFADRVVLEITERASLETLPDLPRRVANLRSLGYRLAIDDLGAGYAGLGAFADLEPDIVKLDMKLIRNVETSLTRQKVIRSMIQLAKDMGAKVVAEGVESEMERLCLVKLGVDLLQGFLFAKPRRLF